MKTLILSLGLITIVLLLGCGNQPKSQEDLNAELWEAVKIADVARVESLLESGADPNVTGQSENKVVTLDALIGSSQFLLETAAQKPGYRLTAQQKRLLEAGATIEKFDQIRSILDKARSNQP